MAFIENVTKIYSNFISGPFADIAVAIIVFFVGFIAGKLLGRFITKLLHEIEFNKIVASAGVELPLEEILGNITSYIIYFISVIWALSQFEAIASPVLYILASALVILIIVSMLLAVKDFIPNFFAGLFLLRSDFAKKGNYIRVGTTEGKIIGVSLLETQLETKDGDLVFLPNSLMTKSKVILVRNRLKK